MFSHILLELEKDVFYSVIYSVAHTKTFVKEDYNNVLQFFQESIDSMDSTEEKVFVKGLLNFYKSENKLTGGS